MELATLAAKQKRLKDWNTGLSSLVQDEELRVEISKGLDKFKGALARSWDKNIVAEDDLREIADLERQIENLFEEARLRVVPKRFREMSSR